MIGPATLCRNALITAMCLVVCGCAAARTGAARFQPTQTAPAAPTVPPAVPMEMFTFSDGMYRSAEIPLHESQQVMFMFLNHGRRIHAFYSSIAVANVDTLASDGSAVLTPASNAIDVSVLPGQETDVTFTPILPGRYVASVDGSHVGTLVVTP